MAKQKEDDQPKVSGRELLVRIEKLEARIADLEAALESDDDNDDDDDDIID